MWKNYEIIDTLQTKCLDDDCFPNLVLWAFCWFLFIFYFSLILCHQYCFSSAMNLIHLKVMIRRKKNSLFLLRSLFICLVSNRCDHCFEKKVKGKKIRAICEIVVRIDDLLFIPLVLPFSPPLFTDYSLTIFYISLSTYSTYLHTLFMKSIISRV